jgi:RNA polymerase sigma factor (sigma-70 family)
VSNAHEIASPDRTDAQVDKRTEAEHVRRLIRELPATQRATVQLAYYGELTQAEIANELNVPLGAIKSRQRLALTKLHGALTHTAALIRLSGQPLSP